jgi:hypothetical protein
MSAEGGNSEERNADMQGIEKDDAEMSFRRGYQEGVIEVFYALERSLDPATRDVLRAWIEEDIYVWRIKAMLGYPPIWRFKNVRWSKVSERRISVVGYSEISRCANATGSSSPWPIPASA